MRPRVALTVGAVSNLVVGLVLVLAPAQLLSSSGWSSTPDVALVPARDAGTVVIVLGIVSWLARNGVGTALQAVLWGNLLRPAGSIVVNGWEYAAGIIPSSLLPVLLLAFAADLALVVIFASALRRAVKSPVRADAAT